MPQVTAPCIAAALLVVAPALSTPVRAQDESAQNRAIAAALSCRDLADADERLACLDQAVDALARLRPAPPSPTAVAQADAEAPVAPSVSPPEPAANAAAPTRVAEPTASTANTGDDFGAEDLQENRKWTQDGPQTIESRAIRIETAPGGSLIFTLENGQVWRQLDADSTAPYIRRSDDGHAVTIKRAALGSYRLKIEGVRQGLRVRRVQ